MINKKNTFVVALLVTFLVMVGIASAGYNTIYNPFTGKLDYVSDGNFTASTTFVNITVTDTATIVTATITDLIATNLEGNLDATGYNITAINEVAATLIDTTNLEADNLESDLDGTGYDITAAEFKGYINSSFVQNTPAACPSGSYVIEYNGTHSVCGSLVIVENIDMMGYDISNATNIAATTFIGTPAMTITGTLTFNNGATITDNSTCLLLRSPDGSGEVNVCNT